MENNAQVVFDELVAYREELQRFCGTHYRSVIAFRDGISFKVHLGGRSHSAERPAIFRAPLRASNRYFNVQSVTSLILQTSSS